MSEYNNITEECYHGVLSQQSTEWCKKLVSDEYKRGDRKIVNQQNFLGVSNMHIRKCHRITSEKWKACCPSQSYCSNNLQTCGPIDIGNKYFKLDFTS